MADSDGDAVPGAVGRRGATIRVLRWLRVAGALLLLATALGYRSFDHRVVAGRWSFQFAVLLVLLVGLVIATVRTARRPPPTDRLRAARAALVDIALFSLGVAHALFGLTDPGSRGRIADVNVFGSVGLIPSVLEWIALVAMVVWLGLHAGPWLVRRGWENAGVVVATLAALALLGEGALRIRASLFPVVEGAPTFASEMWARRYFRRNAEGYRDVDHRKERNSRRRVLVVGDSFGVGWGVEDIGDRFSEQLVQRLGPDSWEAITIAEPNRHTLQEIEMLRRAGGFCADLVVLLYVFNDIAYLVPGPSIAGTGRLDPIRIAFTNSYLFQRGLVWALAMLMPQRRHDGGTLQGYLDSALASRHREDLSRFVDLARSGGAAVMIVPFQVTAVADSFQSRVGLRFANEGLAAGLPIVRIDSVFAGHSFPELTVNRWDRHPSPLAHRLAAGAVAAKIRSLPELPRSACPGPH